MADDVSPVLLGTLNNPIPEDAVAGWLFTRDGTRLRYGLFGANIRPARGTVCVFGGRGECIEKYFETVQNLRDRRFDLYRVEWAERSGRSPPALPDHGSGGGPSTQG